MFDVGFRSVQTGGRPAASRSPAAAVPFSSDWTSIGLSERFAGLGCSRFTFVLRMTRQDIGSYLGIQIETVSRTLSGFCAARLIQVEGKVITLRDLAGLRRVIEPEDDVVVRPIRSRVRRAAA